MDGAVEQYVVSFADDEEEAARAYDDALRSSGRVDRLSLLNFPTAAEQTQWRLRHPLRYGMMSTSAQSTGPSRIRPAASSVHTIHSASKTKKQKCSTAVFDGCSKVAREPRKPGNSETQKLGTCAQCKNPNLNKRHTCGDNRQRLSRQKMRCHATNLRGWAAMLAKLVLFRTVHGHSR